MSSSFNPGENQLTRTRIKLIGLTLASAVALAGTFYHSFYYNSTGPKKEPKQKILEPIKPRILKPKIKVAVIVNQPINIIASVNKPDPTVFPGREEDLADE